MIELFYLLIFFFCLAFAAGAVLLSQKLKISQREDMFESLFYYVILMTFFGFYGIWGQVLVNRVMQFLSATSEILSALGHLVPLMGFPFLVMGGYMYLRFANELWGKKISRKEQVSYFLFYLILLAGFGWMSFIGFSNGILHEQFPLLLLVSFFLLQDIVIHLWFLLIQLRRIRTGKLSLRSVSGKFILIIFMLLILRVAGISVIPFDHTWLPPVFIFVYFISLPVPVFYIYRHHRQILHEVMPGMTIDNTREKMLKKNGVTRREEEIIGLICKGNTNQEIADILFISLQTVKDHTHRIYLKLDVKNRMQLIHLLQQQGSQE